MKKVSIVILNWNGLSLLKEFLPTVVEYSCAENIEVVVADNFSTDDSLQYITETFPQVRIIALPENYGFAKGYNKALAQVEAEYVILLNSDVEVTPNWLNPVIRFLDNHKDVVALQPKILAQREKSLFEYAGAAGGFIDKYGYPFCRGRIFDSVEEDNNQYDNATDIFWASGACLAIRLNDFRSVGGFDERFFAHMEEIDLCWRLNAIGNRIMCLPQSVVYHVGAATLLSESPRKTFLNFRNNLLMLYKNTSEQDVEHILRIRFLLDYLAAFQMLLSGKRKNAKAILKAYKEFKKLKPEYNSVRRHNLSNTIHYKIKTVYPKSILWSYFIKGTKTFDKLKF